MTRFVLVMNDVPADEFFKIMSIVSKRGFITNQPASRNAEGVYTDGMKQTVVPDNRIFSCVRLEFSEQSVEEAADILKIFGPRKPAKRFGLF